MSYKLTYRDKSINYTKEGSGNTIVLLHGFLESLKMWEEFSKSLSKEFSVICIDLPGFGETAVFSDIHSMEFMAEVVKAVLDENKVKHCVMTGHSMGGYVALAFAEKYHNMLKGFTLFHSHAGADTEEARINRDRAVKAVELSRKSFINQFIPSLFAPDNVETFENEIEELQELARLTGKEAIIAALKGMRDRKSKLGLLMTTSIPVQFILGKQDSKIPYDKVLVQTTLPKHSEITFLRDAGHMGFLEEKEITLNAIRSFASNCFR